MNSLQNICNDKKTTSVYKFIKRLIYFRHNYFKETNSVEKVTNRFSEIQRRQFEGLTN